jgi:hypothetical protein
VVGAGAVLADAGSLVGVGSSADVDSSVDVDLRVARLAASTGRLAVGFTAEQWPTVVAGSTAVAVDTVAAVTGNRGGSGV